MEYREKNMPVKLKVFKGYTVDWRLREFRQLIFGKTFDIVPFDSIRGQRLLADYRKGK